MTRRPSPEVMTLTDPDLEEQLIGNLIIYPHHIPTCAQITEPADFFDPNTAVAFRALIEVAEREGVVDAITVADRASVLRKEFDRRLLLDWMGRREAISMPALAAERIHQLAMARKVRNEVVAPRSRLINQENPWEVAADVRDAMNRLLDGREDTGLQLTSAAEILGRAEDSSPWEIPGLLRAMDRLVFVAGEGAGKTTLISQCALCAEAGLHPFTRFEVKPRRVLRVDFENPKYAVARSVRMVVNAIRTVEGFEDWSPQCPIWERPAGLDLLSPNGQRLLTQAVRQVRPNVLFIGPLYKMFRTTPGERADAEGVAQALAAFLDDLRENYGLALWIEGHAPKGEGGKNRDLSPIGSSVWFRWPEYGRSFRPADKNKSPRLKGNALDVGIYRGDRNPVTWPSQLIVGHGGWPFTGYYDNDIQLQIQGFR